MSAAVPIERFGWTHGGRDFSVAYQTFGAGPNVLFLPAMSTVSTRTEWGVVAARLSGQFTVTLVDWPGFGASSRPPANYSSTLYDNFLRDFARTRFGEPVAVVAAGHAAGYVLRTAVAEANLWSRAVLAAPTWRGPLPTVMGPHSHLYTALRCLVTVPGLGNALYHLNTSECFLRLMYGRHVFADSGRLPPEFLAGKQKVARQSGARFAAAAFVTGAIDPFATRSDCLAALQTAPFPVLLLIGDQTPPKSRAEMDHLSSVCPCPALILPGSLGLHEEYADAIVTPAREFLNMTTPKQARL